MTGSEPIALAPPLLCSRCLIRGFKKPRPAVTIYYADAWCERCLQWMRLQMAKTKDQ
jgi:hypothetical protein